MLLVIYTIEESVPEVWCACRPTHMVCLGTWVPRARDQTLGACDDEENYNVRHATRRTTSMNPPRLIQREHPRASQQPHACPWSGTARTDCHS